MNREQMKLADGDWEAINKKCGFDVLDIIVNLDNRFSMTEQADMIVKRCNEVAQAQLNKCLSLLHSEECEKEIDRILIEYAKCMNVHKAGFGIQWQELAKTERYRKKLLSLFPPLLKEEEKEFFGMKYPFTQCARSELLKMGRCLECSVREFCEASEKEEK